MEAIERENNAREALGMNIGNNSNSNSNNSGGTNGTEDDDDDDQEQVGRGGGGSGGADADEKDAVSERLAAMKRAVETKVRSRYLVARLVLPTDHHDRRRDHPPTRLFFLVCFSSSRRFGRSLMWRS